MAVIVGGRRFVINSIKRRGKFPICRRLYKIKRSCRRIVSILNFCQVFDQMPLRNLVLKFHFIGFSFNSGCVLRLCWDPGGRESEKLDVLGTESGTISVVGRELSWFGNSWLVSPSYMEKRSVRLATFHLVHDFFDHLHDKGQEAEGLTPLANHDALCKFCIHINAARFFEFVLRERDDNALFLEMTTDQEHFVAICIGKLLLVKDVAQLCYSLAELSHLLSLSCHHCKRDYNTMKISCKEFIKLLEFFHMEVDVCSKILNHFKWFDFLIDAIALLEKLELFSICTSRFKKEIIGSLLEISRDLVHVIELQIKTASSVLRQSWQQCLVASLEHRDRGAISNCLLAYSTIDDTLGAEEIFCEIVVSPTVQKIMSGNSQEVSIGNSVDELENDYEQIMQFVERDCRFVLKISSSANLSLHVFDLLGNSILKEVFLAIQKRNPGAFSHGKLSLILKNFKSSLEFLAYLEGYCPSRYGVSKFLSKTSCNDFSCMNLQGVVFAVNGATNLLVLEFVSMLADLHKVLMKLVWSGLTPDCLAYNQALSFPFTNSPISMAGAVESTNLDHHVFIEARSHMRIVTLNKPHKLIVISFYMIYKLTRIFITFENENNDNMVLLKGSGRSFCAGIDICRIAWFILFAFVDLLIAIKFWWGACFVWNQKLFGSSFFTTVGFDIIFHGIVELISSICGDLLLDHDELIIIALKTLACLFHDIQTVETFKLSNGPKIVVKVLHKHIQSINVLENVFDVIAGTGDEILKESFMDLHINEIFHQILSENKFFDIENLYEVLRVLLTPNEGRVMASQVFEYALKFVDAGSAEDWVDALNNMFNSEIEFEKFDSDANLEEKEEWSDDKEMDFNLMELSDDDVFNTKSYLRLTVDKPVEKSFFLGTIIILLYNKAKMNTRLRVLARFFLYFISTLSVLVLDLATHGEGGLVPYIGVCVISRAFGLADGFFQGGMVGDLSLMDLHFVKSFFAGLAASGALTLALTLVTKVAFEKSSNDLRKGALMFFAISTAFELLCLFLYAYVFQKLLVVQYYRLKAIAEGAKIFTTDLAATGLKVANEDKPIDRMTSKQLLMRNLDYEAAFFHIYVLTLSNFQGFLSEETGNHSLGSWYVPIFIAAYNVLDLIGRYTPLIKALRIKNKCVLLVFTLASFLFISCFYFTAKYGDQGWMIFLVAVQGFLMAILLSARVSTMIR